MIPQTPHTRCLFCGKDHAMRISETFKHKPNKKKVEFMTAGCLEQGPIIVKNAGHVKSVIKKKSFLYIQPKKPKLNHNLLIWNLRCRPCLILSCPWMQARTKEPSLCTFLNAGSSATFCTEAWNDNTFENHGSGKERLWAVISGMEVAPLKCNTFLKFMNVYTQRNIPVTGSGFEANYWWHLCSINTGALESKSTAKVVSHTLWKLSLVGSSMVI